MNKKIRHIIRAYFKDDSLKSKYRSSFALWLLTKSQTKEKEQAMSELWQETPSSTTSQTWKEYLLIKNKLKKEKNPLKKWINIAAIIIPLVIGVSFTYFCMRGNSNIQNNYLNMEELFTSNGEIKDFILDDGTHVWVAPGSTILFPSHFSGDKRQVYLSGKARFDVAKNKEKPFIVKTKSLEIEALGTLFDVESYSKSNSVSALLEEGSIKISFKSEDKKPILINPNSRLKYNKTDHVYKVEEVDCSYNSLWIKGYLTFIKRDVFDIFNTIELKFNVEIDYRMIKNRKGLYNVKFRPNEDIGSVIKTLSHLIGFKYRIVNNRIIVTE